MLRVLGTVYKFGLHFELLIGDAVGVQGCIMWIPGVDPTECICWYIVDITARLWHKSHSKALYYVTLMADQKSVHHLTPLSGTITFSWFHKTLGYQDNATRFFTVLLSISVAWPSFYLSYEITTRKETIIYWNLLHNITRTKQIINITVNSEYKMLLYTL